MYNRPDEVKELLQSLTDQTYKNFEVLIIEDGSADTCRHITESFREDLDIRYYYKENSGQGFSRNYGFERARGDYFIVFDSDCLIPNHYFSTVQNFLVKSPVDAFGGPDRAHPSFTPLQRAISYSMTSPFTTGGIRGNKRHTGTFHPRSFNMGISREVFEKTGGYRITRMGEDIEFSIRILEAGFTSALIPDAYVYHKRRTSLRQFYNQLHFFGRARINISRFYPSEIKAVHLLPSLFTLGLFFYFSTVLWQPELFKIFTALISMFMLLIITDSTVKSRSFAVGLLSALTSVVQLIAYGVGFLSELRKKTRE